MLPRRARRWLFHTHLYLGLACAPYLVIYGVSSLAFNHGWGEPTDAIAEAAQPTERWTVSLEAIARPPMQRARSARAQLEIAGALQGWTVRAREDGSLSFRVARPGKRYDITIDKSGRTAEIQATRSGWLGVVRELHGLHTLPHSLWGPLWASSWTVYTHLSLVAVSVSLATGSLLFWRTRRDRTLGLTALALGAAGSAGAAIAIFF